MQQNHTLTRFWQTPAVRRARHLASPRLWYQYWTAHRRRLPGFVIAGAQKAGTTSLFGYLASHPQCAASLCKEVHYFDKNFSRGTNWYRGHFPIAEAGANRYGEKRATVASFESSPYYMFDPRVPARMRQSLPDVKVIFLLRNPVSRAYSHYHHSVRRGCEPLTFQAAIDEEPKRLAGEHQRLMADANYQSFAHRSYSYLARGMYADQLRLWQAHFPPEQLLVVQAERMFKQPGEVFGQVLEFLGLDAWSPAEFGMHNPGRYSGGMPAEVRDHLASYFAPHNERLFDLLRTRYDWR